MINVQLSRQVGCRFIAFGLAEFAAEIRHGQPYFVRLYLMNRNNEICCTKSAKSGGES